MSPVFELFFLVKKLKDPIYFSNINVAFEAYKNNRFIVFTGLYNMGQKPTKKVQFFEKEWPKNYHFAAFTAPKLLYLFTNPVKYCIIALFFQF